MAQNVVRAQTMPELQLRQELRNRFPEINGSIVMKVMKMYNNDPGKCLQALEQESQRSTAAQSNTNSHPYPPVHTNDVHHGSNNSINRNNNQVPWNVASGNIATASGSSAGMSRYQEVPVKHETHISTMKHNVAPPVVPPKPLPPRPEPNPFAHPTMPPVQTRPHLVIDPANRGDPNPRSGMVRPPDFSTFMDPSSRRQSDIPNIRCPLGSSESGGASGGSPESRRPVRVIVQGAGHTGGTVTSGPIISPTSAHPSHRYRVLLKDGGGMCSMPVSSAPVTTSSFNPYQFSSQAFVAPQTRAQEADRPGVHSSSIYIDPATNPRRTSLQDLVGDPTLGSQLHQFRPGAQYMDSQLPVSQPGQRTMQPLTVSLSSHAISQELSEQGHNVSFTGKPYPGGFATGLSHTTPPVNTSDSSSFGMNLGHRYSQDGACASPPHGLMSQLNLSSGSAAVCPAGQPASSPSMLGMGMVPMFGVSPAMMPKSPRLQHQRSSGSSTSRSNSMDSEHGSSHHLNEVVDHSFQPHSTPPIPAQRGMGVMEMGVPNFSPVSTSSHSSLSSESSVRDRDLNSLQRRRSGSIQEEAAYTQALLVHQKQRMDKLMQDINSKKQLLCQLRQQVSHTEKSKILENSLRTSFPTADDISRLCESNRRLQTDIQMYLNEIDMYRNGQTPFTIIDPMGQQNFFNNMPTGPNDLFSRPPIQRNRTPPPPPPPRPPPPRVGVAPQLVQRVNSNDLSTTVPAPSAGQMQGGGSADSEEGEKWACSACTFENHPALKKCEICEMPRLMSGREDGVAGVIGSGGPPTGLSPLLHPGQGGKACYCHNKDCQQKLYKQ